MDLLMPVLPKSDLSHWVGRAVHKELPEPFRGASIRAFAKAFAIDLSEAEKSVEEYRSIGELFARRLKPGLRPLDPSGWLHPCDSRVTEAGPIDGDQLIQAKGMVYSVYELLRNPKIASRFEGGQMITYYLCPTDYHRVHSSVSGQITWSIHVPGEFWPVNSWSVTRIPGLFATNERVAWLTERISGGKGSVATVMVAATNVGNIKLGFDEGLDTSDRARRDRSVRERVFSPPLAVEAGDEMGVFQMGSTVVQLYCPEAVREGQIELDQWRGKAVRVGAGLRP
jgi:phosphatidylserine decarboxylase